MRKLNLSIVLICLFLTSCSTVPKPPPVPISVEPTPRPAINYPDVQNKLNVELSPQETGFREKKFDACDLGPALDDLNPALSDCHQAYFILAQLQLSCRASEDTSQVISAQDLSAVRNQSLRWEIGKLKGQAQTDIDGRVVIRAIAPKSNKKAFLRLSNGTDFLQMRVEQATEVVTPPSWCAGQ